MTESILIHKANLEDLADILSEKILSRITKNSPKDETGTSVKKISATEFCKRAGITKRTFYNWKDKGIVTAERIGGRFYLNESEVSDFFMS